MIKKTVIAFCMLIVLAGNAQQVFPIQWKAIAEKNGENSFILRITASIADGWHVYIIPDPESGIEGLSIHYENTTILPGEVKLSADTIKIRDVIFGNEVLSVVKNQFSIEQSITCKGRVPSSIKLTLKGFTAKATAFLPIDETKEIKLEGGATMAEDKLPDVDPNNPAADCGDNQSGAKSSWTIFLLGVGGGLIALLTPCIFPMIPVTVSFFTNRAKTKTQGIKNATLYGSFILLIYAAASIPFHLIGNINPQIFNIVATNPWVNVFFFTIFIFFALSFFGLFEIKLPSSIANNTANKGGIFFMALTLVVVSFSCTGIILGSLLVNALSAEGSAWQLTAGMSGFGLALALPFALFALFPQWLKKLPKSGGWLDTVKKTLAFVELALALKFLSNADLVEHWGLLKRETFIAIWILIAVGLALYLLGVFNKKQLVVNGLQNADNLVLRKPRLSKARIGFGIGILLFAAYLVQGIIPGASSNIKLLSGFPPPLSYSLYEQTNNHTLEPTVINDYDKAIQLAKQSGKPLLIDFTGWACVNCRKMEEQVWTLPSIQKIIKEKYILVSLYVDDRGKLSDGRTIGERWAKFQERNFKQVTQPLYVILSPDEKLMTHPVGYTPAEATYKAWLQCGIDAFEKQKQKLPAANSN